jgi:hypothetical protein
MAFDYTDVDTDDEAVRAVASEMAGKPLAPLSEEDWHARQLWREECRQREAAAEAAHERDLAVKREAAERERAAANAQAREKAQRERTAEIERGVRERTLSDLRLHAVGQERRQRELDNALRQSARQQSTNSLMAELERAINESAPLTKPAPNFSKLYRENQRSGWYYEDSNAAPRLW